MCKCKLKNLFKAGIFGTVIGLIIGLLSAKKPGKETREELKKKIGQTKDKAVDLAQKTITEAKEIKHEVEKNIEEVKGVFSKEEEKE